MRRVLITGANRGIGLELVKQFLESDAYVLAGCRDPRRAHDLHTLEYSHPNLKLLRMDVSDENSIDTAKKQAQGFVDGIDLLFNNAGVNFGEENITNLITEEMIYCLQVNAIGPILVAKHFLELLKKGSKPIIINISSDAGSISNIQEFRGYSYSGSKAALNMYTRALAFDESTDGIIVIALHPGWVSTDMGGSSAPLTPPESAAGILNVVNRLTPAEHGKFLTIDGSVHPW